MKHRIEITNNQAKIMRDALEMYARTLKGQSFGITDNLDMQLEGRKELEETFGKVFKPSKVLDENSSISWDLYQSIRYSVAWHESPEGGLQVCFDSPMKTSKEPLPQVVRVPETDLEGLLDYTTQPLLGKVCDIVKDSTLITDEIRRGLYELGLSDYTNYDNSKERIDFVSGILEKIKPYVIENLKTDSYDPTDSSSENRLKINKAIGKAMKTHEPNNAKLIIHVIVLTSTGKDAGDLFLDKFVDSLLEDLSKEN